MKKLEDIVDTITEHVEKRDKGILTLKIVINSHGIRFVQYNFKEQKDEWVTISNKN